MDSKTRQLLADMEAEEKSLVDYILEKLEEELLEAEFYYDYDERDVDVQLFIMDMEYEEYLVEVLFPNLLVHGD